MLIFALPLIFAAKVSNKQEKQIYRIGFGSMTACILLSRVTCHVSRGSHLTSVTSGYGPGQESHTTPWMLRRVAVLAMAMSSPCTCHVSRVTSQLARGATCHLVAHHARVAQTVDVGGVGGQLQLLQPGHVSGVTCHVSRITREATLPGEEVLHDVWDLLRVPEQVSGHVSTM